MAKTFPEKEIIVFLCKHGKYNLCKINPSQLPKNEEYVSHYSIHLYL